jgi:hypothetical protein
MYTSLRRGECPRDAAWRLATRLPALAAAAFVVLAGAAYAAVPLTRVSSDPFTNPTSQHATEVEPDTFAHHGTAVATFQVGRFFDGGSTDIGVVRSATGGAGWGAPTFLPGITFSASSPFGAPASPYERVSDPSVAYDARHGVWLISSIPLRPDTTVPTVLVSRSTDDGQTWGSPIAIPAAAGADLDKNWTVCDNTSSSPFYGHCYTSFDNFGANNLMLTSTSADGGLTWSAPAATAGNDRGLGGQPVVQPSGTVIVPFQTTNNQIAAFRSTDGGVSWTAAAKVSAIRRHTVAGGLRSSSLPSAESDASGNVYVAWEDCRFRQGCSSNDIVYRRSSDGVTWGLTTRVPIDDKASGADHFVPGLAVSRGTGPVKLALTYYFYPAASCPGGCQLEVGYISSPDGGASWSSPITLAGPMSLSDIAQTSQGPMVGDYISTSFSGGKATSVFAVGLPHTGSTYDEAMYAPTTPLAIGASSASNATQSSDRTTAEPSSAAPSTRAPRTAR